MHDDLLEVAARRARAWIVVLALAGALGPALVLGVIFNAGVGLVAGVVTAVGGLFWLLTGATGLRRAAWPRAGLGRAGTEVTGIAEGIGLATGRQVIGAWEVEHAAPNVGAFATGGELSLVVTDSARALLTRDQLEAVCAAQLAIAADPTCRRLEGAVAAVRLDRALGFVALVTLGLTVFLFPLFLLALATVPASAAAWLVGGRVRWWSRVAADAVCVRTTRHPEPLVQALRLLARSKGEQVQAGFATNVLGIGGSQWAVELGPTWTSQVRVNGRLVDQRTAEMVEDTRLLVRAALVRRVCLEQEPATVTSYRDVAAAVRRAGRAAAAGGAAEVDGELVGLDGVVAAAGPPSSSTFGPPPGWFPDPSGSARLRWWDGTTWTGQTSE